MKKKVLFILCSFFCVALVVAGQTKRRAKAKKKAPVAPAADVPSVTPIGNAGLKKLLTREAGQKPLLVNFWATWCEPCVEEFPELVKIDADYKARGLEFVTVSFDEPEELKKGVPRFLKRMNSTMPAYLLQPESQEEAFNIIGSKQGGLPITVLYNSAGQVAYLYEGKLKIDQLRAEIEKVLDADKPMQQ